MLIFNRTLLSSFAFILLGFAPSSHLAGQTLIATIPTTPQPAISNPNQMIWNAGTNKVYAAGDQGHIAILNGSTGKRIGTVSLATTEPIVQMFANPITKRVYVQTASTFSIIDSTSDTVSQRLVIPGVTFSGAAYLPGTDRLYLLQLSTGVAGAQLVARDGATLAQIAILASGVNTAVLNPQVPTQIIGDPGNNQLVGFSAIPQSTWVWVWDTATNTLLDQSTCGPPACTKLIGGSTAGSIVNPMDHTVWAFAIVQGSTAGGGDEGSGPLPLPFQTVLTPITVPLARVGQSFVVWGAFAPTAFDPSGKLVGYGTCVPRVPNPSPSTNPCGNTDSGLYGVDLATPVGSLGQLINLGTFLGGPGNVATWSCGAIPLGYDADLSQGYWSCNGSGNGPVGNVGLVKYNLTQAPDTSVFPPRILGQWLTELPTHALHAPTLIDAMTVNLVTHRAFFPNAADNSIISVDPVAPSLSTELLSSRPAAVAVNSATNTVVISEDTAAQITTVDGASNTVTAMHLSGGTGPYLGVNPVTNQIVTAGVTDNFSDPTHSNGAFLFDGTGTTLVRPLTGAATGGLIFDPPTFTGIGVGINPSTNRAYLLDQMQWYVVDLATGSRIFTGRDFAGGSVPNVCQFASLAVNAVANRYYVIGQCPASVNGNYTLGVFDGDSNAPIKVVTLENFSGNFGGGWGRIAVNPNTNRLYLELVQVIGSAGPLGPPPPTTMIITYDALTLARVGTPITPNGGAVLASFPLAIDTVTNRVFATQAGQAGPQLLTFDGGVDAFGRTDVLIASQPNVQVRALAVNEATGHVYVASDTLLPVAGAPALNGPGLNVFEEPPVPARFSLSGTVTSGGVAAAGISVVISSSDGGAKLLTTDSTGAFSIAGLPNGSYFVTPESNGFFYTPAFQTVTIAGANLTGINFTATVAFHISGRVVDGNGNGLPQQSVGGLQFGFATTDATGAFTLVNVIPGSYTLSVSGGNAACCFLPVSVTVSNADVAGIVFNQLPKVVISGLSFSPALLGANVSSTGTVTLASPAPAGGIVVQLQDAGSKVIKLPATVTVPAGAKTATFTIQASGVSTATPVNITAVYGGLFSPDVNTFANATVTVEPVDSLKVTSATWSKSTQLLTVNATSSNPVATLTVFLSAGGQTLGVMTSNGAGTFTLQTPYTAGTPSSINVKSNLGGSTGQGVSVLP